MGRSRYHSGRITRCFGSSLSSSSSPVPSMYFISSTIAAGRAAMASRGETPNDELLEAELEAEEEEELEVELEVDEGMANEVPLSRRLTALA